MVVSTFVWQVTVGRFDLSACKALLLTSLAFPFFLLLYLKGDALFFKSCLSYNLSFSSAEVVYFLGGLILNLLLDNRLPHGFARADAPMLRN